MLGKPVERVNRNDNSIDIGELSCTMHDFSIEEMLTGDDV
jgi:hypothetical protein